MTVIDIGGLEDACQVSGPVCNCRASVLPAPKVVFAVARQQIQTFSDNSRQRHVNRSAGLLRVEEEFPVSDAIAPEGDRISDA